MREDRTDAHTRALVVELIEASPIAPPFPDAAAEDAAPPKVRNAGSGIAVALATFLLVVGVAAGAFWFASQGRNGGLGTGATAADEPLPRPQSQQVAVVAGDGTVLRGSLWIGDSTGIVVVPGYSDNVGDVRLVAESLASSGHTVMFYNIRGQRPSGGLTGVNELPADLAAAISDLRTRGVDRVFVVGYHQSASAAVVLAEQVELAGVAAVFPYAQTDSLNALDAAAEVDTPMLFVAARGTSGGEESAVALAAANGRTAPYILSARPPAALSADHFSPKVVNAVLQFVDSGA